MTGMRCSVKAKLVVQVKLRSGESERVCMIDNARIKVGSKVTLKNSEDPKRRWEVVWVSEAMDSAVIHVDWKVGGL